MIEGLPFMWDFLRRMVPPDPSVFGNALRGAIQTIQIAIVGTVVAAVLALPIGFAAARNAAADFANPYARVGYAISTMVCTPSSLAQSGAAALGAMAAAAPDTRPELRRDAGGRRVELGPRRAEQPNLTVERRRVERLAVER